MHKIKQSTKILLLEDDITLSEIISEFLIDCGYEVVSVCDGLVFEQITYEQSFDILLLDIKVPYRNGFDLLNDLRVQNNATPAIFITSLSSIDDLSKAYDIGCDDYLRKPFELKELQLRIQTLLKRDFSKRVVEKITIFDDFSFDLKNNKFYKNDQEIFLQKKESKILKLLLAKRGELALNEEIAKVAWAFDEDFSEESLRTHIKNLRKLFGKEKIANIRGQGYTLVEC